ncbi:MAG: DUF669 domain-containing protein [Neomegalonema sp.]
MNHQEAMAAQGFQPFDFDTNSVEADDGPSTEPLPAGDYIVFVQKAEFKMMKADPTTGQSKGTYVEATFEVADGPHKGRLVWDNMTWHMPTSDKATQIGRGQLKALTDAVGIAGRLTDVGQLVNGVPLKIKVAQRTSNQGKIQNEVKKREAAPAMTGSPAPQVVQQVPQGQVAQTAPQGQVVQMQQPAPVQQQAPAQTVAAAPAGGRRGAWAG